MSRRTSGLREAWKRTLREDGARLLLLVRDLNGSDSGAQMAEHWNRLTPGLKGIGWRLPGWPNVFPPVIVHERDDRKLLELINDERTALQQFMDSWFDAGRNYAPWVERYPGLARTLDESSQYVRVRFHPLPDGRLQAVTSVEPPVNERTRYAAAVKFGDYLQNPLRDLLTGRCKRCRRYFFNRKGYEQMVYCSQKCRWDAHNAEKKRSREQAQQKMEATALAAMRKLYSELEGNTTGESRHKSWKHRVVEAVNQKHGAHFEPKWLTRTINNPDGKYHKQFVRVRDAIERRVGTADKFTNEEEV